MLGAHPPPRGRPSTSAPAGRRSRTSPRRFTGSSPLEAALAVQPGLRIADDRVGRRAVVTPLRYWDLRRVDSPVLDPWMTRLGAAQAIIGAGALAAGLVGGTVTMVFGFPLG